MTEETNRYSQIRESIDKRKKLEDLISKSSHSASQVKDAAMEALQKEIYSLYTSVGQMPADITSPADINGEKLSNGAEMYKKFYNEDKASILKADPNKVFSNMPGADLESLASQKLIVQVAEGKDKEILAMYNILKSSEDLKERISKNKGTTEEESERLKKYIESGSEEYASEIRNKAIEKEKERQTSRGYQSKSLLSLAAGLTEAGIEIALSKKANQQKLQKDFIMKGIDKEINEIRKAYETLAKDNHDYLTAIRNTLIKLGSSDDPSKFGIAEYAIEDPKGLDKRYTQQN